MTSRQFSARLPAILKQRPLPCYNIGPAADIPPFGVVQVVDMSRRGSERVVEPTLNVKRPGSGEEGVFGFNGPGTLKADRRGHIYLDFPAVARIRDYDGNEPLYSVTGISSLVPGSSGLAVFRVLGIVQEELEPHESESTERRYSSALVVPEAGCSVARWRVTVLGAPTSGAFDLRISYSGTAQTDDVTIQHDATAEEVQDQLEAVERIGLDNVTVDDGPLPADSIRVTFGQIATDVADRGISVSKVEVVSGSSTLSGGVRARIRVEKVRC